MLRKLIGNIRRQPKRTRDNVALGVASTVTFVVALVWVFNAPTMFSGLTGVGETAKKEGGFLDTISEQTAAVKDAFSSESAATESIKELIKEAQEPEPSVVGGADVRTTSTASIATTTSSSSASREAREAFTTESSYQSSEPKEVRIQTTPAATSSTTTQE